MTRCDYMMHARLTSEKEASHQVLGILRRQTNRPAMTAVDRMKTWRLGGGKMAVPQLHVQCAAQAAGPTRHGSVEDVRGQLADTATGGPGWLSATREFAE